MSKTGKKRSNEKKPEQNDKPATKILVQCCVCGKTRNKTGKWGFRRAHRKNELVSHTYCPECYAEASRTIREQIAASHRKPQA